MIHYDADVVGSPPGVLGNQTGREKRQAEKLLNNR